MRAAVDRADLFFFFLHFVDCVIPPRIPVCIQVWSVCAVVVVVVAGSGVNQWDRYMCVCKQGEGTGRQRRDRKRQSEMVSPRLLQ